MNIVLSVVTGLLWGGAYSFLNGIDDRDDLFRNVMFGVVGAYAGIWLLGLLPGEPEGVSFATVVAGMSGSAIALFVARRFRQA